MNKGELVNAVAKVLNSKKEAQTVVDHTLTTIMETLKKGDEVNIQGFGTFKVASRKARKGRNPQTGETIQIKASKVPKFVPGKAFKEIVR